MPLDPRISLAATAPIIQPPDLVGTMLTAAKMREMQSIQGLRDMQAQQALEQLAANDRMARVWQDWFRGGGGGGMPGTTPRGPSPLSPQALTSPSMQTPLGQSPPAGDITQTPLGQPPSPIGPPAPFGVGPGVVSQFGSGGTMRGTPLEEPQAPPLPGQPGPGQGGQAAAVPTPAPPTVAPPTPAPETPTVAPPSPAAPTPSVATPAPTPTMLPGMQPQGLGRPPYAELLAAGRGYAFPQVKAGMEMEAQEQTRQANEQVRQLNQIKLHEAGLDVVSRLSGTVRDQASLDEARVQLEGIKPGMGRILPQAYDPQTWGQFQQGLLSQKDKLEMQKAQIEGMKFGLQVRKQSFDELNEAEKLKVQQEDNQIKRMQAQGQQVQTDTVTAADGTVYQRFVRPQPGVPAGQVTPLTTPGGQPVVGPQKGEAQSKTTQQEQALHNTYNAETKSFREVRDSFGRIIASSANPSAASDIALLTAFMKMLDPTTGVRQEEYRNAVAAGGLPAQVEYWLNWLKTGKMPDDVRKQFLETSKGLYEQYVKDYTEVEKGYRDMATRQKLNPDNVVLPSRSTAATPPGTMGGGGGMGGGAAPTQPSGAGQRTITEQDIQETMAGFAKKGQTKTRQEVLDLFRNDPNKRYRVTVQ